MIMSDTEGDTTSEDEERPHARRRKPRPALKVILLLREAPRRDARLTSAYFHHC